MGFENLGTYATRSSGLALSCSLKKTLIHISAISLKTVSFGFRHIRSTINAVSFSTAPFDSAALLFSPKKYSDDDGTGRLVVEEYWQVNASLGVKHKAARSRRTVKSVILYSKEDMVLII